MNDTAGAGEGSDKVASLLLDAGADINAQKNNGTTILHDAAENGFLELASLLIDRGANVEAKDNDGRTPLHGAFGGVIDPITKSANMPNEDVASLLLDHGANVEAKDNDGRTPRKLAIRHPWGRAVMNRHRNEG